ncbi:hypothetical protein HK101_011049 [Irineochytrium annulatum]|nr:hypothetical protein HK101_011049 [Irineochytrium annulatum]
MSDLVITRRSSSLREKAKEPASTPTWGLFSFTQPKARPRNSSDVQKTENPSAAPCTNGNGNGIAEEDEDDHARGSHPNGNGFPERNASESELLALLESENASLRQDPKSVLAEEGNLMTDLTTLQTLTSYLTKSVATLDEEETRFWNSIIEEANEDAERKGGAAGAGISKISNLLMIKIRRGIPPHLRSQIWKIMAGAQPKQLESIYANLLQEESSSERIIKRDIPRTFPKLEMFKDEDGQGQKSLFNLLKAYSVYDRECGYCQGLSFVVAPLLMQNMSELDAFAIFVRLMEETPSRSNLRTFGLRTLFMPQMPGLHLMLYQHSELVRLYLPRLFAHLVENNVMADTYASPWFLTLFTYNFPLPLVFRIFDIIFAEGAVETMLRFSIAVLKRNQENLLNEFELEGILEFLKGGKLYKVYEEDPEKVVQDAVELETVITPTLLGKIAINYQTEKQLRRTEQMSEVKQLRLEAQRLTVENSQLTQDVATLRESLHVAENRRLRDLQILNGEFEAAMESWQAERRNDVELIRELQSEVSRLKVAAGRVTPK